MTAPQLLYAYNALYRVSYGSYIPTTNVSAVLKDKA